MAQLSRPYQIALGALVIAVAMFLVLGRHTRSPGGSAPGAPAQSSSSGSAGSPSGAGSGSGAGSSHIYHGSAPGLEGLSKDIAKAHGAVETSETYSKHIEEKSASAAGESAGSHAAQAPAGTNKAPAGAAAHKAHKPAAHAHAPAAAAHAHAHAHAPAARAHARTHAATRHHAVPVPATKPHTTHTTSTTGVPSGQRAVEGTVTHGKVALLLFWNPNGADDAAVRGQVHTVGHSHLPVVVYEGNADDVASFGAITRQVPVYGTPTILIVGVKGRTSSLTGLQDAFAIEQAIDEARTTSP